MGLLPRKGKAYVSHVLSLEKRCAIVQALVEGCSVSTTTRAGATSANAALFRVSDIHFDTGKA